MFWIVDAACVNWWRDARQLPPSAQEALRLGTVAALVAGRTREDVAAEGQCSHGCDRSAPEQADERVSLVAERQAKLVRTTPPLVFMVLDESCLRRPIGGPAVMDAQLARLVDFAELPNTVLQVAPFDMGERRPFDQPLHLLTLSDRQLMSYAESAHRGHLERESTSVLPILTAYHQLQAEALSQAASVDMINQLRNGIS
ncbi:putative transcriptional regulator [Streptomyces lydicamycinicus]|uniref:Putative transcriptional regulator n=1 Tax=Streptomyces lydicamycinicus TaxID=1546107 RepID=A0A0N7YMA9_9ACTN|nr:putative transcriptional regulator [Streptomyces lydicamycinicus]